MQRCPALDEQAVVCLGGLVGEQHARAQAVGRVPEVLQRGGLRGEALHKLADAGGVQQGRCRLWGVLVPVTRKPGSG